MNVDANPPLIRPLDAEDADEVDLVAARMRETLVEVLGLQRARAVHSEAEIRERLLWHVDPLPGRQALALVSVDSRGSLSGHTLLRVEREHERDVGLVATTYVAPPYRRQGVAARLLAAGETWLSSQGVVELVTYTDAHNTPLQELYRKHGYGATSLADDWVRLCRLL